ncbi:MAG TPA: phosphate ABC transporter permease PstA [Chloroflexota bacterium]|nr:phosphate ABC transporter permease PstA [Chloroflexota bacterium]
MLKGYLARKWTNLIGNGLALLCVIAAIIPLGAMLFYVLQQGGSSLDLNFFTQLPKPEGETGGGMAGDILGTLLLIGLASCIGLPIGILGGIYLARSSNLGFSRMVRFVTDVIAGTPSIVAGVVAYALVVIPTGTFSAKAGAVALGILMFPTVTRATEETIKLVPPSIREAALALGVPEWKAMVRVILPAATNGIVTAIMLGIARVAGETAPLYLTVLGSSTFPNTLNGPIGALPVEIWHYAQSPYPDLHRQAWAGAFVLFSIIVILNLAARVLTFRLSNRVSAG